MNTVPINSDTWKKLEKRASSLGFSVEELLEKWLTSDDVGHSSTINYLQQRFIESIKQAVIATKLDGEVIYWNRFAEKVYGWQSGEAIGTNLIELVQSSMTPQQHDEVIATLSKGDTWSGEYHVQHKDGHQLTLFVINYPHLDEHGKLVSIIGTFVDITERKREQDTLRQNEARLQLALDSANSGLWDWHFDATDHDGLSVNSAYAKILGYTSEEFQISNNTWESLVHPDDLDDVNAQTGELQTRPDTIITEYRMRHKAGHYIWVHDHSRVIERQADGTPLQIIGTIIDISERKKIELDLLASENRFRAFMDNFTIGQIYIMDDTLQHVYGNKATLDYLGITLDEYVGTKVHDMFPKELADQFEAADRIVLETGETQQHIISIGDGNHNWQWVQDHKFRFTDADGKYMVGGISVDITELKQIEEALRESEARHRTVTDNFPNGLIALFDTDLRYTVASGEGLREIGLTLEGKRLRDIFPPEVYERDEPALLAALNGERRENTVFYDGEHFRVITAPIRDAHDQIIGGMVMSQNISELKNAQNELADANKKLSLAIRTAKLGIWELDVKSNELQTNQQLIDIYGIPPEDADDIEKWRKYAHAEDRETSRQQFREIVKSGEDRTINFRINRDDGQERHIQGFGHAIHDENGKISKIIGINIDITEIVESRQKLEYNQLRLLSLVETHSAYIIRTDINGFYTYANSIFFDHFASHEYDSVDDMMGAFSLDMIVPEDQAKTYAVVMECIANPSQPQQATLRKPRATGEVVHTVWEFVAIPNENGDVIELQCIGIDITHQLHMQKALQKSQERFESTLQKITDYVWSADIADGRLIYNYISPVIETVTGYPREYFFGDLNAWITIIHKDDLAKAKANLERELAGETMSDEYRIVRSDGEIRWINSKTSPTIDEHGVVIHLDGIVSDITDRKQVESALQESENRYRALFNEARFPIVIYDANARIVMLNDIASRNLGVPPKEAIGKTIGHYFPQNQAPTVERIRQVIATGKPLFVEDAIMIGETEYWFSSAIHLVPTIESHQPYVQIVSNDITEQKHAEAENQKNEEKFRAAIEASLDAFYMMESVYNDDEEIVDFRILEINDNAVTQLGIPRETLVGGLICELFPINRTARFFESYKEVAETGQAFEQEFFIPDGNVAGGWYHHQVVKVGNGVAIMTRDITDRKHRQQLIVDNQRMTAQFQKEQERNTLIQQIVSTLSHDLRNSLAIVSTSSDILTRHFNKLDDEKRQSKLDMINRQIEFATTLLQDTVDHARGKMDKHPFKPKPINLATLCRVSVQEVGSAYNTKHNMKFFNTGNVEFVNVDETLISRILLNLLSNAIKYTPEGGNIDLTLDQHADQIILQVKDTGIGISADDLPYIFEPLFRVNESKDIEGTGLGLSIVQDCVIAHHGQISVESQLDIGTTFTVELPTNVKL